MPRNSKLTIYVARHGQNEDNAEGILNGRRDRPLTPLGQHQAKELLCGIREAGLSFDAVYSSPLTRAVDTARIVCEGLSLGAPTVLPELIERDFGSMTGEKVADIAQLCGENIVVTPTITYFLSPPRAETFPELLERAHRALVRVCVKHHAGGSVLLVTHGDLGKMLYAAYYGLSWREVLSLFHFGNSELLVLSRESPAEESHVVRIVQHNH